MQDVNLLVNIISSIILSFAALFGVITYFRTAKNNKAKAAMELVCYYAEILLPTMSFIRKCANEETVIEIEEKLKKTDLYFIREEMDMILNLSIQEKYNKIYDDINLESISELYLSRQFKLEYFKDFYENHIKVVLNTSNEEERTETKKKFVAFMKNLTHQTLNQLEYFAMSFLTIGDQKIVYASIHQTFLKFARFFYIEICTQNQSYNEYYFMNIQNLYNKWNSKQNKYAKFDAKNRKLRYNRYKSR